jgi:hypothetical protein
MVQTSLLRMPAQSTTDAPADNPYPVVSIVIAIDEPAEIEPE